MTVEQATKFFQDNCYYEEKPAHQEAIRGSFDPGYLYYTLGKLQIFQTAPRREKQEGQNYSLKRFHDELLGTGCRRSDCCASDAQGLTPLGRAV